MAAVSRERQVAERERAEPEHLQRHDSFHAAGTEWLAEIARSAESKLTLALRESLTAGTVTAASFLVPESNASIAVTIVPMIDSCDKDGKPADSALLLGQDLLQLRRGLL